MGLDLTVIARPKPGFEGEATELMRALAAGYGVMGETEPPKRGILHRLFPNTGATAKKRGLAEMQSRFNEITTPGYASVGAPVVGQDEAADTWVRQCVANGSITRFGPDPKAALQGMAGLHILPLAPACDGLPLYCNAEFGYVDETSFRGAFVKLCTDVLSEGDRLAVWGVMEAEELRAYGERVRAAAADFAARQGLQTLLTQREAMWMEDTSHEAQVHIAASLSRWAIYWGSRGFGSYPDF